MARSDDNIEICKSIFVPWKWLAVVAFGLILTVAGIAIAYEKRISHIDNITAEEGQQRIQADSSISFRLMEVEKRVKQLPSDLDTIKSLLRKKP
jgi:hypothetical protein